MPRGIYKRRSAEERFWAKVSFTPEGCWLWLGSKAKGYGKLRFNTRMVSAPRFAYELTYGPIPTGLELDHLCRNRACVNPAHLEAVPHRTNALRGGGVGALGARKTYCQKGHRFDIFNTYISKSGKRQCRTCHAAQQRARRQAKRRVAG